MLLSIYSGICYPVIINNYRIYMAQETKNGRQRGSSLKGMRVIAIITSIWFGVLFFASYVGLLDPLSILPGTIVEFFLFWYVSIFGLGISFISWIFSVVINVYIEEPLPKKLGYLFIAWSAALLLFVFKLSTQ